jgi:hypothetical protein
MRKAPLVRQRSPLSGVDDHIRRHQTALHIDDRAVDIDASPMIAGELTTVSEFADNRSRVRQLKLRNLFPPLAASWFLLLVHACSLALATPPRRLVAHASNYDRAAARVRPRAIRLKDLALSAKIRGGGLA